MCQLTFADFGKLNKLYITNQLIFNALDNNPDGVGVLTEGTVWKSHLSASNITNLGECINSIVDENPILGHVRLASNKTLNKVEHSHPFKGELLTQIHNGKLEPNDYTLIDRSKVDSEVFLEYLENEWKNNKQLSFPDVLTKVMKEWKGKFALMYHIGVENKYYIARGKEADLHYTTVNGKLVVNTSKESLTMGLRIFDQLHQILHREALNIDTIREVPKESIFMFDRENSELIKVGEIEEVPTPNYTIWQSTGSRGITHSDYTKREHVTLEQEFQNALLITQLSIEEADYLAQLTMGNSLLEMTITEIGEFIDTFLTLLGDHIHVNMSPLWTEVRKQGKVKQAYEEGLEFPWMFNKYADFINVIEAIGVKHDTNT